MFDVVVVVAVAVVVLLVVPKDSDVSTMWLCSYHHSFPRLF